ncbi:PREDICTED: uncharacterized protein LOC105455412 [Wasmannia auropunctata]|uniref:uncharacterized protein LOC105455412 n=1 Tax=Wasmannia auropunctata TaxID=64793 RepID=UPI0005EE9C19|nr:PREDICTED: uncharacterized protein LOC105455412 [Wasmannia auropunctata]
MEKSCVGATWWTATEQNVSEIPEVADTIEEAEDNILPNEEDFDVTNLPGNKVKEEELHEFPVIVEETNDVETLLSKDELNKITKDPNLLKTLVTKELNNTSRVPAETSETSNYCEENENNENSAGSSTKEFLWPDAAVYLLLELYRERETDFTTGMKRHYVIWSEIASKMIEHSNGKYNITGQQCSAKLSGLKRTYIENIVDQNKKSGNCRNSWAFFSVIDSILGKKAYITPPAIASSEGPAESTSSTSSSTESIIDSPLSSNPQKKRRVETVLESFIKDIKEEREEARIKREIERQEFNRLKEERYEKHKEEREQMHKEKIEIQKSLVQILSELAAKSK